MDYNARPAKVDIEFTQGDTINFSYEVFINSVALILTGLKIRLKVRRKDGLLVKDWSTVTGEINTLGSIYNVYTSSGFIDAGDFDYDVDVTDVSDTYTFQSGSFHVIKQITT